MAVKIIGDPGSAHCGNIERAEELIRVGRECGLDAVKFQLFPNTRKYTASGNVSLPLEWFPHLVQYGLNYDIEVFASVFTVDAYKVMCNTCQSIKFSYNSPMMMWARTASELFANVYVSYGVMDNIYHGTIPLWCIPEYPVKYMIDFDGIFPRFEGFSDHTMGYRQTIEACRRGAKVIEKHYKLDDALSRSVPDGRFALSPVVLSDMVRGIRCLTS